MFKLGALHFLYATNPFMVVGPGKTCLSTEGQGSSVRQRRYYIKWTGLVSPEKDFKPPALCGQGRLKLNLQLN
jgi:hypothetical protein